jgi:hypothetical protein
MDDFEIHVQGLESYEAELRRLPGLFARAQTSVINNMAFGVRTTAIDWGIPMAMIVRSPNILRLSLRVDKAVQGRDRAVLGMASRDRFGGLLEQELGGKMKQQTATLAARGGQAKGVIRQAARLRSQFVTPDDIEIANNTGSTTQRIAAFITHLEKTGHTRPFVIHGHPTIRAGLYRLGKRTNRSGHPNSRKLVTLRQFHSDKIQVRQRRWLRPSIDRWLSTHSRQDEWRRAVEFLIEREARRIRF